VWVWVKLGCAGRGMGAHRDVVWVWVWVFIMGMGCAHRDMSMGVHWDVQACVYVGISKVWGPVGGCGYGCGLERCEYACLGAGVRVQVRVCLALS